MSAMVDQAQVFTDMAYLQRIASAAANETAVQMKEQLVTKDEVEGIVKESINQFLEHTFDIAPGDRKGLIELRKDFAALRSSRELKEAMVKHGILAVVGIAVSALVMAVWFAIKGPK
jgi:hypothetical protein